NRRLAGLEPDHEAQLSQDGKVAGLYDDTAAGGDNRMADIAQRLQHFGFKIPKMLFAALRKDGGDRLARLLDDERIRIDEAKAQTPGNDAPDRRLAASHEADK